MKPAHWLWITLGITVVLLLGAAGFNAWIDPLWTFDHAHRFNSIQAGFNERQQKPITLLSPSSSTGLWCWAAAG